MEELNETLIFYFMHFTKKVTFGHFTASRVLISVLGHLPPEKLSLKAKKAVSENEKGEEKTGKEKKKAKYAGGLGVFSKNFDFFFVFGPHSRVHTFFEGKSMNLFVLLDACQNSVYAFFEVKTAISVRHFVRNRFFEKP